MLKWKLFKKYIFPTSRNLLFCLAFFGLFIRFLNSASAAQASLQFSPSSGSYNLGASFTVSVLLNTGGARTSATDLDIIFDANKLVLADIAPGNLYGQYVGENINNATGRAIISGLASSPEKLYTGSGTFATLSFKAIDTGTAEVKFSFIPGNRNDSGVYDHDTGDDILTTVNTAAFNIGGTSTTSTTTTSTTADGSSETTTSTSTQVSADQLPVAASPSSTLIMAVLSIIFIALGAITAKLSF